MKDLFFPSDDLTDWFLRNKRSFPWREEISPYKVLISEMMLQQTRASVVVDYFSRWMAEFPDLSTLAKAPLEKVIKMWEGLGYYSRARFLHEAAKTSLNFFEGKLPENENELSKLKGIGPYTLSAILSFAFHKKKAAVDGNVMRVLARFFAIFDPIDKAKTKQELEILLESILPEKEFWVMNEALIELGALVCKKKPDCEKCPLQKKCQAFQKGITDQIPAKSKKIEITKLKKTVVLIVFENQMMVEKGDPGKKFADLYFFPTFDEELSYHEVITLAKKQYGINLHYQCSLEKIVHSYTRFRTQLHSHIFYADSRSAKELWIPTEELLKLPFSAGHRRLLEIICEKNLQPSL